MAVFMDDVVILKMLGDQVRSLKEWGITATVNYADRPDSQHQPDEFSSADLVRLRAVKSGKVEQI